MHIDNKNFYCFSFSSYFPLFRINPQSLKVTGVVLTALTLLASYFYLLYVKIGKKKISNLRGSSFTPPSLFSFFQHNLNPYLLKTPQSKEATVKTIENILQKNPQAEHVYLNSVAVPTALLRQLIQNEILLDEKELASLYTLRTSKGETFSLSGFEKALLLQHSVLFKDFWRGKSEEKIALVEDGLDFDRLKTLLQSLYDPKILEKKEKEIYSLAEASIKFQLNVEEVNQCLEKVLVASFEKNEAHNITTLLNFFKSSQKPLTKTIQHSLQAWLNRSIGTPTFSANILILKEFSVTSLDFSDTSISDQELSDLSCLSLSTLILKKCKISDQGLKHLQSLTQLQNLNLNECKQITDEGVKCLKNLTQLQELNLACCIKITDEGIKSLKSLSQLQKLNLAFYRKITDEGLRDLQSLTQLQEINLAYCNQITDERLRYLQSFTHLKKLTLTDCTQITDQGLKHLQSFDQFQKLKLAFCRKITDQGLEYLKSLTQLQELDLDWCNEITDQGLKCLQSLTQLKKLTLNGCNQITDEGLRDLQSLTQLQKLNLVRCYQITDQGLKHLQGLTQLQKLNLTFCRKITDQGLEYLKSLTQLQELNLEWCNEVTKQGLKCLQSLAQLKVLGLINCNQTSSQARDFFKNSDRNIY